MLDFIFCPHCRKRLQLPGPALGQVVQCPSCQKHFEARTAPAPGPLVPTGDDPNSPLAAKPLAAKPLAAKPFEAGHEPIELELADASGTFLEAPPMHPLSPLRGRHRDPNRFKTPLKSGTSGGKAVAAVVAVVAVIFISIAINFLMALADLDDDALDPLGPIVFPGENQPLALDRNRPLTLAGAIDPEFRTLFENLARAFRERSDWRMAECFDAERMFDELRNQSVLPPQAGNLRGRFVEGARRGLGQFVENQASFLVWARFEIKKITRLPNDEAAIVVRHRSDDGGAIRIRWWLSKRSGAWKFFDLEDMDLGLRSVIFTETLVPGGLGLPPATTQGLERVRDAVLAVGDKRNPVLAEQNLDLIGKAELPPAGLALRHLTRGLIHLQRNEPKLALDALNLVHKHQPDMAALDITKATALNRLGRYAEALKHVEAFHRLVGDDSSVCREYGETLRGLGRRQEAAVWYRKGLDDYAKDIDAFLGLLRSLDAADDHRDVGERFAKLADSHASFDECAQDCVVVKASAAVERLALAMQKIDADYAPVYFYSALARAWDGDVKSALAHFRVGLAKDVDKAKRQHFTEQMVHALAEHGRASELFTALGATVESFALVAGALKRSHYLEELGKLTTLHARQHADDPLLALYRADVLVADGFHEKADKLFSKVDFKKIDFPTQNSFRSSRVLARYHAGQALSAFLEIGPKHETFLQLGFLCQRDEKMVLLHNLVDAYAKDNPPSLELDRWRIRINIRQGKVDDAITLFKAMLARCRDDAERRRTTTDFLFDMADSGKAVEGYRAAPDAREALQYLAENLIERGQWSDLGAIATLHRRDHPGDPWGAHYAGEVLLDERAWAKAAEAFGEALRKAPNDLRERWQANFVFAQYKAGKGVEAYTTSLFRDAAFRQLADNMARDKKPAELVKLLAAHRRHAPEDPEVFFVETRLHVLEGKLEAALASFQLLVNDVTAEQKHYVTTFVTDMADLGQGMKAYRAAPDRPAAFEVLANRWHFQKKEKELATLLEEHGLKHAASPRYQHYAGELSLLRRQPDKAEKHFRSELEKAARHERWSGLQGLERALVMAGKTLTAYEQGGKTSRTFASLANHCLQDKNAQELEVLLAACRQAHPDFVDLPVWQAELHWLKGDAAAALQVVTEHRKGIFARTQHQWRGENLLVRSLIRLKRTKEAVAEMELLVEQKRGNNLLAVLAYAAAGDVAKTIATVEKQRADQFLAEDCYHDPDLGPILRSEAFAAFRTRFPEGRLNPM